MDFQLIKGQQQEHIETTFLESECAQKITSLINSEGGVLVVGIKSNGKIHGVYPKDEIDNLPVLIQNRCSISFNYSTEILEVGNKLLVLVRVNSASKIGVISEDTSLKYYYRIDGNILQSNKIMEAFWKFKLKKETIPPCSENELSLIYSLANLTSLSQLYTLSDLPKSHVDQAVSWLLYDQKLAMSYKDDIVIYQHLR